MNTSDLNNLIFEKMKNVHIKEDSKQWRHMYLVAMLLVHKLYDYKIEDALDGVFVKYQEGEYDLFIQNVGLEVY